MWTAGAPCARLPGLGGAVSGRRRHVLPYPLLALTVDCDNSCATVQPQLEPHPQAGVVLDAPAGAQRVDDEQSEAAPAVVVGRARTGVALDARVADLDAQVGVRERAVDLDPSLLADLPVQHAVVDDLADDQMELAEALIAEGAGELVGQSGPRVARRPRPARHPDPALTAAAHARVIPAGRTS